MATVQKPAPAVAGVFELTDEQVSLLAPKSKGRAAQPSPYLEAVRESLALTQKNPESGAKGVAVTANTKATTIAAQLRKAGKQLSTDEYTVHVQIWDRSESTPPFVGFKAVRKDKVAATE